MIRRNDPRFKLLTLGIVMAFLVMSILANEIATLRTENMELRTLIDDNVAQLTLQDTKMTVKVTVLEAMVENMDQKMTVDDFYTEKEEIVGYRLELSDQDKLLLAKIIESEAGICDYETKVATGCVVVNRVLSDLYPDTLKEVIYEPGQFDVVDNGRMVSSEPSPDALRAAEAALTEDSVQMSTVMLVRALSGPKSLEWIDYEVEIGRYVLVDTLDKDVEFYKVVN